MAIAQFQIQPQQDTKGSCSSIAAVGLKEFLAVPAPEQELPLFHHPTPGLKHIGMC